MRIIRHTLHSGSGNQPLLIPWNPVPLHISPNPRPLQNAFNQPHQLPYIQPSNTIHLHVILAHTPSRYTHTHTHTKDVITPSPALPSSRPENRQSCIQEMPHIHPPCLASKPPSDASLDRMHTPSPHNLIGQNRLCMILSRPYVSWPPSIKRDDKTCSSILQNLYY